MKATTSKFCEVTRLSNGKTIVRWEGQANSKVYRMDKEQFEAWVSHTRSNGHDVSVQLRTGAVVNAR